METNTSLQSSDYRTSVNRHVFGAVPKRARCLDVGCWNGNLGRMLIEEKGCQVDGVDFVPEILAEAQSVGYEKTFQMNLNGASLDGNAIDKRYDVIIFADVLEHLANPQKVLEFFSGFLEPEGKIIISLPNVAFLLNRLQLLCGKWEYKDFGILDKTHLRFFTLASGQQLVKDAGLRVLSVRPYNQFGVLRYLDPPVLPNLFAYQFLITAGSATQEHQK